MKPVEVGKYLVVDPRVCFGQLTFKGTRLPVETILIWMSKGKTLESILKDWPHLNREAVTEAVQLAASALIERSQAAAKAKSGDTNEPDHPRRAARRRRSARPAAKGA